jgi:hypothetical protein
VRENVSTQQLRSGHGLHEAFDLLRLWFNPGRAVAASSSRAVQGSCCAHCSCLNIHAGMYSLLGSCGALKNALSDCSGTAARCESVRVLDSGSFLKVHLFLFVLIFVTCGQSVAVETRCNAYNR